MDWIGTALEAATWVVGLIVLGASVLFVVGAMLNGPSRRQ